MPDMRKTHTELIERIPGGTWKAKAAAIGCGCKHYQVRDWSVRNMIPPEWWLLLTELVDDLTVTELLEGVARKCAEPEEASGTAG